MPSLRQFKKRIRSIESTRKITRAMELVSNTKLRRIAGRANAMRPYVDRMDDILRSVMTDAEDLKHPLLEEREEKKRIAICLVTSDSGLCGPYNTNILRATEAFLRTLAGKDILLVPVGKKGFTYFRRRGYAIPKTFLGLNGRYQEPVVDEIVKFLQDLFFQKQADEVYVAYTRFESNVRHHPAVEKFLNIKPPVSQIPKANFIWEPSRARIFEEVIPEYLLLRLRSFILQAFACEHSARIVAMSMAKENAEELLDQLTLLQNKMRQASITKEVLEIVSAAEALKG